jgi:hypothetical protein
VGLGLPGAAISAGGDPCGTFGLVPERSLSTGDVVPLFTSTFLHDRAREALPKCEIGLIEGGRLLLAR